MKAIFILFVSIAISGCTSVRPGPDAFESAERAIGLAVEAGGDEFAPVEMRFAREKLESARIGMEKQKYEVAMYLVEESEINAELAIEKSRTGESRRRANELRKSNDELEVSLRETFGDEFE